MFDRVGYRFNYEKLRKMEVFKEDGVPPIESVLYSDFNEAVRLISLQNAIS